MLENTHTPKFTFWIVVVVFIAVCIETDIYIPSLPNMLTYFHTTESMLSWVLSINFFGMCIASAIIGPLSDHYGRKPVLKYGFFMFALSSLGCYFSTTIEMLLAFRFLQGISASTGFVVGQSIIFDIYTAEEAGKIFGNLNSLVTFVMAGAPVIGGIINRYYGFHANFLLIAISASIGFVGILLIPETNKTIQKKFNLIGVFKSYKAIITNQVAMINVMILWLLYATYMIYVAYLSLMFVEHLKMDPKIYDYYQGIILLVFAFFSWFASKIIDYFGFQKTFKIGLFLGIIGICGLFITGQLWPGSYNVLTLFMSLFAAGFALSCIKFYTNYMSYFGEATGAAAAFGNILRFLLSSIFISITGYFFTGPVTAITNMMFLLLLFCMGLLTLLVRKFGIHL